MPERKHVILMLALAGVVTLPSTAGAQAVDARAGHQHTEMPATVTDPPQAASPSVQERRQAMRQRMLEIRTMQDPDKRHQLIEAQMKDMEALLDEGVCPQPGGGMMAGQGGQGMMGRGMQHPGMGGKGMQGGMACGMGSGGMRHGMGGHGPAAPDEATIRRLDALEKRVDLLQMMLQMQAR